MAKQLDLDIREIASSSGQQQFDWGNAKPPLAAELEWIDGFGKYPEFDPKSGNVSNRVRVQIADLKQATRIIVRYHYLHRGRTMAQLPYWILVDEKPVGVILYSLPRLSATMFGIRPMNLIELARMWLSPDVQGGKIVDSKGKSHSLSIASSAIGKSLKVLQKDWFKKYPTLPDALAVISWADDVHHEGTIYKASNFVSMGKSGGGLHGNRARPNGGRDQLNQDYGHIKSIYLYRFDGPLSDRHKALVKSASGKLEQTKLFEP